jgi:DNA-binding NarL/FixJ family response regulator
MNDKKTFTYVSPKTNKEVANSLCNQLPIIVLPVSSIEELFPLLSDPMYYTDFVGISVEMFYSRSDKLDMFDIINTLSTLIKSTVHRSKDSARPHRRTTKIFVIVDETTDPKLVKEIMQNPNIATVSWLLKDPNDYQSVEDHCTRMIAGDFTHHPKVLELVKPKKKLVEKTETIELTMRQSQVLQIIQDRGASNKVIAKMLGITESTVKLHISAILKKYGVKNRTQLAVFAR